LAALEGVVWLLTRESEPAALIAGLFAFTLTFAMVAVVATFLSRAYEAALRAAEVSGQFPS
jgi:hypothetical protein